MKKLDWRLDRSFSPFDWTAGLCPTTNSYVAWLALGEIHGARLSDYFAWLVSESNGWTGDLFKFYLIGTYCNWFMYSTEVQQFEKEKLSQFLVCFERRASYADCDFSSKSVMQECESMSFDIISKHCALSSRILTENRFTKMCFSLKRCFALKRHKKEAEDR